MTTATQNIEETTFEEYTIAKDFERFTVHISKPSPRSRLGIKVVYYHSFKRSDISASIMQMNMFVDKFVTEKTKEKEALLEKKVAVKNARKDFKCPYVVGQIFYNSYGYDQTNVNFYQVVKIEGKTVILREIAQDRTDTGYMCGDTMPCKDQFVGDDGDEIKRIIQIRVWGGRVNVGMKNLYEWDGKAKYWSSYA